MTRNMLLEILAMATGDCRDSCTVLAGMWETLGEDGLIEPTTAEEYKVTARKLFTQAVVMRDILADVTRLGNESLNRKRGAS